MQTYPDKITGDRVILKGAQASLANAMTLHNLVKKNEKYMRPFLRGEVESCSDIQTTLKFLRRSEELRQQEDTLLYFIFHEDKMIGAVEALLYPQERELRYWLDDNSKGKGLMQESVLLMEKMLFEHSHERIILSITDHNVPSLKLAKRLGYTLNDMDYHEMTYDEYKRLRAPVQNKKVLEVIAQSNQR